MDIRRRSDAACGRRRIGRRGALASSGSRTEAGGRGRMTDRSIDIRDISVIYPPMNGQPEIQALKNVSLRVRDGERLGIIGPNGAGKSTLLQVIAGVLKPTSGDISVNGRVHALLTVGMGLREEVTGRE